MNYLLETQIHFRDGNSMYLRLPTPYDTFQEAYGVARTIQEQYQAQDSGNVSSRHWFVVRDNDRDPDPQYVLGLCHPVEENFDIWG